MAVPRERIWWLCPKRVKQHLRIKALYGTSENAVKARNRVAITVYVLMAITRERLGLEASFYATLQILSVTLSEKTPILQAYQRSISRPIRRPAANGLNVFDSLPESGE